MLSDWSETMTPLDQCTGHPTPARKAYLYTRTSVYLHGSAARRLTCPPSFALIYANSIINAVAVVIIIIIIII